MLTTVQVISEARDAGVVERGFTMVVDGQTVPGIIWSPERASGPTPVILIGHGATQNKRVGNVLSLARRFASELGYTAVAIDAPGHGDRVTDAAAADEARRRLQRRIAAGPGQGTVLGMSAEDTRRWVDNLGRGAREWKAAVDLLEAQGIAREGGIGFWGVSMGTSIGLPFIAADPRVRAAVLGLAGIPPGESALERAARAVTASVLFVFQWDDELIPREAGLRLFDALGCSDKAMHIHPGGHLGIPLYERRAYIGFFQRHLDT